MSLSTMQDRPLLIASILEHGARVYAESRVLTFEGQGSRCASYAEVAANARRLAAALTRLGVRKGDRVATFAWNSQEHMEAYLAVPSMGAVLHTLNIRLFPDQLAYVIQHAEDRMILVDDSLVPLLARVKAQLRTEKEIVVIGAGDAAVLGDVLRYRDLLAGERPEFSWPELDEREGAVMCYTSGTTGNPKGVVYSHRSIYLHSMAVCSGNFAAVNENDRILAIVPMFHAMAWGIPYAGFMVGADLLMPGRFLQAEPLVRFIAQDRPTFAAAVPTIWNDVLHYAEEKGASLSSLRMVVCGGSAVPRALMERFQERFGIRIIQAWGMTETSPLGAVAYPPRGTKPEEEFYWRSKTGRMVPGVEMRIVDDAGEVLPWDGVAVGEIEVRGPWVTGSYYKEEAPDRFHEGWLRTGDVGTIDPKGFMQITDRAKDVIKSGGEWISSVEVENTIMAHEGVLEAAVVGVPDEKWQERPLACVVRKPGSQVTAEELREFLAGRLAKWWIPERWAFIDQVPRTSVGKFDKKMLRKLYAEGALQVVAA